MHVRLDYACNKHACRCGQWTFWHASGHLSGHALWESGTLGLAFVVAKGRTVALAFVVAKGATHTQHDITHQKQTGLRSFW